MMVLNNAMHACMQIRNVALKGLGLQSSFHSGALTARKAPLATLPPSAAAAASADAAGGDATATSAAAAMQRPPFARMLSAVHAAFPVLRAPPARSELAVPADSLSAIIAFLNSCQEEQEAGGTEGAATDTGTGMAEEVMRDASEDEEMRADDDVAGGKREGLTDGGLQFGSGAHVAVLEHGVVRCARQRPPCLFLASMHCTLHGGDAPCCVGMPSMLTTPACMQGGAHRVAVAEPVKPVAHRLERPCSRC
jgi:hypothetical protein